MALECGVHALALHREGAGVVVVLPVHQQQGAFKLVCVPGKHIHDSDWGPEPMVQGLGPGGLGCRVQGLGFRVRVQGSRVLGFYLWYPGHPSKCLGEMPFITIIRGTLLPLLLPYLGPSWRSCRASPVDTSSLFSPALYPPSTSTCPAQQPPPRPALPCPAAPPPPPPCPALLSPHPHMNGDMLRYMSGAWPPPPSHER